MATITGGDKLEKALRELARNVSKPGTLRVGFLENATYPSGMPVAAVAALNEYGVPSRGQPPRPFFRNMIADKQGQWAPAAEQALKANGYDATAALKVVGTGIAGQLKQSIVDLMSPPLAPSTIARKGHAKPLIDTSTMLKSVDYEVKS